MNDRFQIVGARPLPEAVPTKNRHSLRGKPVASAMILSLIVLGCLFCELIMTKAPAYLDLARLLHCAVPRVPVRHGHDGARHLLDDLVRRAAVAVHRRRLDRHFDAARHFVRRGQRTFAQMARRAADAPDRNSSQRAEPAARHLFAGDHRHAERVEHCARHRTHKLDKHRQGRAHRRSAQLRSERVRASRPSAWAAAFSTFCGVILRRISSRPSSSWW